MNNRIITMRLSTALFLAVIMLGVVPSILWALTSKSSSAQTIPAERATPATNTGERGTATPATPATPAIPAHKQGDVPEGNLEISGLNVDYLKEGIDITFATNIPATATFTVSLDGVPVVYMETYRFTLTHEFKIPSISSVGTHEVSVIATDESGNTVAGGPVNINL